MAHIDSRHDHRRSKMLDIANASVSGARPSRSAHNAQKLLSRARRAKLQNSLKFPVGLTCSLNDDCECAFCNYDDSASKIVKKHMNRWPSSGMLDHLNPGFRMAAKKLLEVDGAFDPWFSWLKAHLPDTLAGRHLLDHIVFHVWCTCAPSSDLGNYKGCSCSSPVQWRKEYPGNFWSLRAGEPTPSEAQYVYEQKFDTTAEWIEWLEGCFTEDDAGLARMNNVKKHVLCHHCGEVECKCVRYNGAAYWVGYWKTRKNLESLFDWHDFDERAKYALFISCLSKFLCNELGVNHLEFDSSGEHLISAEENSFVKIFPTHIACREYFRGSHFDSEEPTFRWKMEIAPIR